MIGTDGKRMRAWKKGCYIVLLLGTIGAVACLTGMRTVAFQRKGRIQESLADKVIRLHVVANSDGAADQELKIKVKDRVVEALRGELISVEGKGDAEAAIQRKIREMEAMAESVIGEEGYSYTVKASLGRCWFPVKRYGDMVFPQGEYEALIIEIGKASGKNWWCVMFPSLCFVDETYQVVPEDSKEALKKELTYEEYKEIANGGEGEVEYQWKMVDWWKGLW